MAPLPARPTMRYLPMLVPGTNGSVRKAKPAASAGDNGRGSINATPPSLQENHVQRTHQPETGSSTEGECCETVEGRGEGRVKGQRKPETRNQKPETRRAGRKTLGRFNSPL